MVGMGIQRVGVCSGVKAVGGCTAPSKNRTLALNFPISSTEGKQNEDIFDSRYGTRAVGGFSCVYHEESNLNGILDGR